MAAGFAAPVRGVAASAAAGDVEAPIPPTMPIPIIAGSTVDDKSLLRRPLIRINLSCQFDVRYPGRYY